MAHNDTIRVGLIGLGAIGQRVVNLIEDQGMSQIEIVGALVRDPLRPRKTPSIPLVSSAAELLAFNPEVEIYMRGPKQN